MAHITTDYAGPIPARPSWTERLGAAFSAYLERLARTEEMDRLNAMTDEELAARGLNRTDIVRYVHRDRFAL